MEFRHFSTLDTFNLQQPLVFHQATSPQPPKPQTSSLPHRTLLNQPSGGKFSRDDSTRSKQDIYSAAAGTTRAGTLLSGELPAFEGDFCFHQEVIREQTEESTVVNLM